MLFKFKKRLYFVVARYFAFWAKFVLKRWRPRVVVITGSSGKTTLLHLLETQLGDTAHYSHLANSAFGIPFDILGLKRQTLFKREWLGLILKAPFKAWRNPPSQKIYIAEADCDRPGEGKFLAELLKPEVVLWVSLTHTHAQGFDRLVGDGRPFKTHAEAIAYEFGWHIAKAQKLVVIDEDNDSINSQLNRLSKDAKLIKVSQKKLKDYQLGPTGTTFVFNNHKATLPGLHPKAVVLSLQMTDALLDYLGIEPKAYANFELPPGRGSIFKGVHKTTLIDSSYNTGLGAAKAILELFDLYPSNKKWLVLGDMLEQGQLEQSEHIELAKAAAKLQLDQLILIGPRAKEHVLPYIKVTNPFPAVWFDSPKEALDYLNQNIKGGETILFKGARFLEGVIEQLLDDPKEAEKLPRRGPLWTQRRQKWGLPE